MRLYCNPNVGNAFGSHMSISSSSAFFFSSGLFPCCRGSKIGCGVSITPFHIILWRFLIELASNSRSQSCHGASYFEASAPPTSSKASLLTHPPWEYALVENFLHSWFDGRAYFDEKILGVFSAHYMVEISVAAWAVSKHLLIAQDRLFILIVHVIVQRG